MIESLVETKTISAETAVSLSKHPAFRENIKEKIVVQITSRDRIRIRGRDVDVRSVRANIERLHAENPEAPVVVQPHPESSTDTMIQVMDSARQAGVYNVSIAAT